MRFRGSYDPSCPFRRMARSLPRLGPIALLVSIVLVAPTTETFAQEIQVAPNVLVSTGRERDVLVETSLAVNPTDPANLLAAAVVIDGDFVRSDPEQGSAAGRPPHGAWRTTLFVSDDAGATWREVDLIGQHDLAEAGDPWVTFGPDGTAYFTTLPADSALLGRPGTLGLAIFRSDDGGVTWSHPVIAPYGEPSAFYDHVVVDIDHSDGPHRGSLYVGATAVWRDSNDWSLQAPTVLRSDDGGRTFATLWRRPQTNLLGGLSDLKVRSDGSVVVLFGDGARKGDKRGAHVDFDFPRRTKAFISGDGARTFTAGYIVTDAQTIGQWDDMAIDRSGGPFHDRIYYTWGQSLRGDRKGVHVLHSDDAQLWSDPHKVTPQDESLWVRVSAAAVNGNGVLGVLWHQRVGSSDPVEQHTWFAASWDGGQHFSDPIRVSDAPSFPESDANGMASVRFPAGGDYVGLAGAPNETFHAAWADARDGSFQIYAARIDVSGRAAETHR